MHIQSTVSALVAQRRSHGEVADHCENQEKHISSGCAVSLPWQQGSSEQCLTDIIKLADPENPLLRVSILNVSPALLHKLSYSRFCVENRKFSLPWQQGLVGAKFVWHSLIGRPRKPYYRSKNCDSILYTTGVMAV